MPPSRRWYPRLYVACIVVMSVQTLLPAWSGGDHLHVALAVVEMVSALGMLVRVVRGPALVLLLTVFVAVAVHSIASGHLPIYLVLYAGAGVAAVELLDGRRVHSPVRRSSGP